MRPGSATGVLACCGCSAWDWAAWDWAARAAARASSARRSARRSACRRSSCQRAAACLSCVARIWNARTARLTACGEAGEEACGRGT